jgi:hypothetical protein
MGEPDSSAQNGAKGLAFFAAATAPSLEEDGIMTPAVLSQEVVDAIDFTPFTSGSRVNVLFKGQGMSLVIAWFGAGYRLPRHSHSANCLYYVVSGSLVMGARTVTAGDGFFVRAEQPYTYTAGPDGVEILEFRSATSFDMTILDQTASAWAPLADIAIANQERWLAAGHL